MAKKTPTSETFKDENGTGWPPTDPAGKERNVAP